MNPAHLTLKILVIALLVSGDKVNHFFTALPYSNIFFYVHRYVLYFGSIFVSCLDPLKLEMEVLLYAVSLY